MLVVSGDWHSDWKEVIKEIKRLDLTNCTIIQVGDFGMGFNLMKKDLRSLDYLNITLKARNITLYAIRGNHDNPVYFDGSIKTNNINLIPDYTVLQINDQNVLCVGGAISIDRKPNLKMIDFNGKYWKGRTEGTSYWSNENFVLKPELIKDLKNIDIVITHSAPDFCEPRIKHKIAQWAISDPGLIEECAKERNDHSKLYDALKANNCPLKHWIYGHFHYFNQEMYENTKFTLLGINEYYEIR